MMTTNEAQRGVPVRSSTAPDVLRTRNRKRDDAIRKKVEQELARKKTGRRQSGSSTPRRIKSGTVSSLRPAPAIIILESSRIVQAAQLMAAKRTDAVLVVTQAGSLVGILTDKDIAYRVVAPGLDVRTTTVASVMTKEPISVYDKGNRNDALSIMVSRRFRHLPVITDSKGLEDDDDEDEDPSFEPGSSTSVVGLLDITKCVFERLDDLERKVNEDENIISAMEALERRGSMAADQVGLMRTQHGCPDVGSVLSQLEVEHMDHIVPEIPFKATVRDAAKAMKENNQTAVLVKSGEADDRIGGICTTKDIVLRVIAASLDPSTTSVVRVMTPHPDAVTVETSVLEALKKLHSGHYLHLPVVDGSTPVGLVDMMTLTISMLTYLASKDKDTAAGAAAQAESGPMWNHFWNSTFAGSNLESESDQLSAASDSITGSGLSYPPAPAPTERTQSSFVGRRQSSMYGLESQSHHQQYRAHDEMSHGAGSTLHTRSVVDDGQFAFKLRDGRTGKVYRIVSRVDSLSELIVKVHEKCGPDALDVTGSAESKLNYLDDEGDVISISSDRDLEEAVDMARAAGWKRLMIFLGDLPPPAAPGLNNSFSRSAATIDVDDSVSSVSASSSPLVRRRTFHQSTASDITAGDRAMVLRDENVVAAPARREESEVIRFLRDAPLPINVAISGSIILVLGIVFVKMIK
ncbi:hypothetical protein HDU86_003342 [Geranomyces michiganensis]|nr:hypothetical protein HDU86_003342 [Geranomyces michiganensis]